MLSLARRAPQIVSAWLGNECARGSVVSSGCRYGRVNFNMFVGAPPPTLGMIFLGARSWGLRATFFYLWRQHAWRVMVAAAWVSAGCTGFCAVRLGRH